MNDSNLYAAKILAIHMREDGALVPYPELWWMPITLRGLHEKGFTGKDIRDLNRDGRLFRFVALDENDPALLDEIRAAEQGQSQ